MKQGSYHLLVCLTLFGLSSCQEESADDILRKSLAKIENIKTGAGDKPKEEQKIIKAYVK